MENTIDICALTASWRQLTSEIEMKRRLNEELFKETFPQTFQLLKGYAQESKLEKEHLPLMIAAYTFSVTDREQAEAKCNAACVLTERMLHRCLMDREVVGVPTGAPVYILEERKEIWLNFADVSGALEALTALMHTRELL